MTDADGDLLARLRSLEVELHLRHTLRTSIWQRTDAGWQMSFHQGTAMAPSA